MESVAEAVGTAAGLEWYNSSDTHSRASSAVEGLASRQAHSQDSQNSQDRAVKRRAERAMAGEDSGAMRNRVQCCPTMGAELGRWAVTLAPLEVRLLLCSTSREWTSQSADDSPYRRILASTVE